MSNDPTIPAVLAGRNADAVGWSEARVGDYLCLRDPGRRADGEVFYITELVDEQPTVLGSIFYVNWVGDNNSVLDVSSDREARFRLRRAFSHGQWQVWRVFPERDAEPEPRAVERLMADVINRLVTKHAKANDLCDIGVTAFRREVNEALGWEALATPTPRVKLECRLHFTLEGLSEDDIDVDELARHIAASIRLRTEQYGVTMVGGTDGISFDWQTTDVTS